MLKKFLHNQAGVSLVMVIMATAILGSGTFYLYEMAKKNKTIAARAQATTTIEAEKKRISTILADSANCKANFFGIAPNQASIASLKYATPSVNFLAPGVQSFKFNLTKIESSYTAGQPRSGKVKITYVAPTVATETTQFNINALGKKGTIIEVPLYMKVNTTTGLVEDCYAIAENSNVDAAISAACQTTTSYYNTTSGIVTSCSTSFNMNTGAMANNTYTDCATGGSPGPALKGYDILAVATTGDTGNYVSIPLSKCTGFTATGGTAPSCAANERAYGISNGNLLCAIPGNVSAKETPVCSGGQLLYKTGSTAASCVSSPCAGVNFIRAISGGTITCNSGYSYTCPAGQYARGFNSFTGVPDCAPFPVISQTCSAGQFAYGFSRNNSTNSGALLCTAYNKTKTCAGTNTFLSYLDGAGNPVCTPI